MNRRAANGGNLYRYAEFVGQLFFVFKKNLEGAGANVTSSDKTHFEGIHIRL